MSKQKLEFLCNIVEALNPNHWKDKVIVGNPQATEEFSVEELKEMGVHGLYKVIDDNLPTDN